MKTARALLCLVAVLVPAVCFGSEGRPGYAVPFTGAPVVSGSRNNVMIWFDDVEGGEGGWTHGDATASIEPQFHVDTYLTRPAGEYSYWCGALDPAFSGGDGYGNGWDQRLTLPPVSLEGTAIERASWGAIKTRFGDGVHAESGPDARPGARATQPVLTFCYRHDSEPGFDFTWVQAEHEGTWVDLNEEGYSGSSGGWQDCGPGGFDLSGFGDPVQLRFRFVSDGAGSDEDGLYNSDGGAFHVDEIRIFDFVSGDVYFYDDCEDGVGLCQGTVPPAAGDWWHIIDRSCPALSDPHCWWCGDDADTSLIPPGLDNWLCTPLMDLSWVFACTVHFAMHFAVPTGQGDYVEFLGTCDGESYHGLGASWGDFGVCNGWLSTAYYTGFDITQFCPTPYSFGGFKFVFHTDDDGCGPGLAGDAGVMLDDVWFEGPMWVTHRR